MPVVGLSTLCPMDCGLWPVLGEYRPVCGWESGRVISGSSYPDGREWQYKYSGYSGAYRNGT